MTPCCTNCSAPSFGVDAVNVCTECASASVAGSTLGMSTLVAGVVIATLAVIAAGRLAQLRLTSREVRATA